MMGKPEVAFKATRRWPLCVRTSHLQVQYLPRLQEVEDLQGDDLLYYDAEMELTNMILLSIPNEIYNSVDSCKTAKEMWDRVECLMRGTLQNQVDRETRFINEFDQFIAEPGRVIVSVYNSFAQLMNDLERNNMKFPTVSVNTKFLNSLQPKLVNTSREKKLEKSHDHLALVAHTCSSSKNTSSYYVTHPSSVVDYDEEYEQDDVHNHSEDPLASAMLLLAKAITQNFSNPTKQSTIDDDQINSDIQFDSVKGNVNSGGVEKDTHVHDLCALETLARNAYEEACKIQQNLSKDQVKPLLNELLDHFDGFQNLFQRDIKEMKDAFEQNDVYLDEIERQNDLLKDQLLEASLKHDIELCVLLNHECVDESLHDELEQVVQIVLWVVDSGCSKHMTGDRSLLRNFVEKFMGTVRFRNDNFAAITGYGDYIHGNITICYVYYVEGLGHNLFSVGQFCDGDLEVAFRSKTYMAAFSPICLMSKATSTKVLFKYGKDHLCSACERGKSKKASHPPKLIPSDYSKLELLHMDLCGPMRVASVNGKKYILVIVDDFSRFTWSTWAPTVVQHRRTNFSTLYKSSDEFNQEDSADFDGNTQIVLYDSLNHEEIDSSTTNLEPQGAGISIKYKP
ncbi:integrase, catalytic region, zinc finger, CCHC-type containing protein [Tanacetum coccineum]